MLGGRLAARQAALRGGMAEGHGVLLPCLPTINTAPLVPQKIFFGREKRLGVYLNFTEGEKAFAAGLAE
jgi:hypothetical protein